MLLAILVSLFVAVAACGDDTGDGSDAAPADAGGDAAPPDGNTAAACYPDGIYGKCGETACPNCLSGATIYQVCTSSCTENSQCGNAADFNGASPLCAELNPGSPQMICVLTCLTIEECPCGLECRASGVPNVNICAETL